MLIGIRHLKLKIQIQKDGIYLQYHGGALFPIANVMVDVKVENVFYEEIEIRTISILSSGKKESYPIYQPNGDMGRIRVRLSGYEIRDMMGFIHKKVKQSTGKYIIIYPPFTDGVPQNIEAELEEESTIEVSGRPDISGYMEDKHEVREYRPGDNLHHIHYKLSYKLNKTMIREFTAFHQEDMRVYLDFTGSKEESATVFSSFTMLANSWIEKGMEGIVSWSSSDGDYEVSIRDERALRICLNEILSHPRMEHASMNILSTYAHVFVINAKGITSMNQKQMEGGERNES